jgi:predicted MFS family arabinose efflux permease
MFIGGAVGSALGTAVYDAGGWGATAALMLAMSAVGTGLAYHAERRWQRMAG